MSTAQFTSINGTLLPASTAAMPVSDRLVRFGDGVFETIRVEDAVPIQLERHLARLKSGLAAMRITGPDIDWTASLREIVHKSSMQRGFLRIAISRGIGSRGYMPDEAMRANWIIECLPPAILPRDPFKLAVSTFTRPPLTSLPSNHKLTHGIGSTLALMEASDQGYSEAIILTVDGKLCEAASANLFWIANGKIFTPALETGCLDGTTRAAVMQLAQVQEVVADLGALHNVDAIFLTNVRIGIWPANCAKFKITDSENHFMIADLTKKLQAEYANYIAKHRLEWKQV